MAEDYQALDTFPAIKTFSPSEIKFIKLSGYNDEIS